MNANTSHPFFIFDFDGTIADTFKHILKISNQLAKEYNFKEIRPEEEESMKGKTSQELMKLLKVPIMKIPAIVTRAKKELNKEMAYVEPADGLEEILRELKKWCRGLGILTSNSAENVKHFLQNNHLDIFDFISTTSKIWSKNTGLKKLIAQYGLDPQKVIYVGDETRDIQAAQKAGVKVAAVTWGYNTSVALKKHHPDYMIDQPSDLLKVLTTI
jgi:phosphoglycolate phosphatase